MNKVLLYSTFFILSLGVILSLLFAYKYVKVDFKDLKSQNDLKNSDIPIYKSDYKTQLQKSWLKKIQQGYKDEPYFYAISEVEIVLN